MRRLVNEARGCPGRTEGARVSRAGGGCSEGGPFTCESEGDRSGCSVSENQDEKRRQLTRGRNMFITCPARTRTIRGRVPACLLPQVRGRRASPQLPICDSDARLCTYMCSSAEFGDQPAICTETKVRQSGTTL